MQVPWCFGFLWVENMLAISCPIPNGKLNTTLLRVYYALYGVYVLFRNCFHVTGNLKKNATFYSYRLAKYWKISLIVRMRFIKRRKEEGECYYLGLKGLSRTRILILFTWNHLQTIASLMWSAGHLELMEENAIMYVERLLYHTSYYMWITRNHMFSFLVYYVKKIKRVIII